MPPSADPRPLNATEDVLARGVVVGRYVVLGLVGHGTMGQVYAAFDPELNRKVAIKLLRATHRQGHQTDRARIMREAQSIARLSHPNVVVVHDVGAFHDTVFIAMEFVEGQTVRYWTLAQPRPWTEILKVFAAAGRGLAAAHDKEIVHRDFKPDNVMVSADGQVRVMDFGLARFLENGGAHPGGVSLARLMASGAVDGQQEDLLSTAVVPNGQTPEAPRSSPTSRLVTDSLTDSESMVGTPAYMPPECYLGRETNAQGDQFSFCVAFLEALYGEYPFAGATLVQHSRNVTEGNVRDAPPNTRVAPWLRKVLLRGLAVDPNGRWPSMKVLLAQFDEHGRRLAEIDEWLAARGQM